MLFRSTSTPTVLKVGGGNSNQARYTLALPVLDIPRFLTAMFTAVPAASTRASIGVLIEEAAVDPDSLPFQTPIGRTSISPATRPPAPRTLTPPVPRGAIIRVTQGGRILAERTVAWISLDPGIKALWFNQQVGAPPDPSVEWIR